MIDARPFREVMLADNMAPLWEVLRGLTPREPKQVADPVIWRADAIRHNMGLACQLPSLAELDGMSVAIASED